MQRYFAPLFAALLLAGTVHAETSSESGAVAVAHTAPVTVNNNGAAQPAQTLAVVEQRGSVKTTGQAFMGAAAVASGNFNCGASGGVAAGWMGGAASVQGAKSLRSCVLLNIAALYPQLSEAALCQMDEGKDVMAEAGIECPSVRRAVADTPVGTVLSSDPLIRRRQLGL